MPNRARASRKAASIRLSPTSGPSGKWNASASGDPGQTSTMRTRRYSSTATDSVSNAGPTLLIDPGTAISSACTRLSGVCFLGVSRLGVTSRSEDLRYEVTSRSKDLRYEVTSRSKDLRYEGGRHEQVRRRALDR